MKKTNKIIPAARLCVWLATSAASPAMAAGGHYAVDDAAILEPGQCQMETWLDREAGNARRLLHLGPACRVGAVEVGLNLDRVRPGSANMSTVFGPQIKWAGAVTEQLSVGLAAAANWQNHSPRYLGSTLVIPVSVQVSSQWLAHVNVGREFLARQADGSRAGAALEWAPNATWSLMAERFREGGVNQWRLGGRWSLSESLSVDLSHAKAFGDKAPAWWTLGLNVAFDR
jgi:hypothetical protein